MSYLGVPNTAGYDYFIYKDAYDSNKIKARNSATAQVEFNHATDFGNVYNSCVAALPAAGGIILIDSGTFETATTCTFKDYITVKGSGMNITVIKLANSANKDVMATPTFDTMISNRPALGYKEEANVIHDVTLQEFSIDGNKANNATGRYGLAKIAYAWNLTNILIYNCKSDGLYSEWGTIAGCPGFPSTTARCMEDYWLNVYIHHCDGQGLRFRGPHDTYMVNLMVWGHAGKAATFEASGTLYSGGAQVHNYHCFATTNHPQTMTEITTFVIGTNWAVEGGSQTGGIGLLITGPSRVQLTGSRIFGNDTGIKIDGGVGYACLEGNQFDSNNVGIACYGVQNKISGFFRDNTTDIELGHPSVAATYNDIRAKCTRSPTALSWRNASNAQNYLDLSVVTNLSTDITIGGEAVPDQTINHVSIYSTGNGSRAPQYRPRGRFNARKTGTYAALGQLNGDGLFAPNFTAAATSTSAAGPTSSTNGISRRHTSGAVSGDNAGIRTNYAHTMRDWNASLRIKFALTQATVNTQRGVFGFRGSSSTDIAGDDDFQTPTALHGYALGFRSTDTIFQLMRNDASGATVFENIVGNPAINTAVHTIELVSNSSPARWGYSFDGGAFVYHTSDVPAQTAYMSSTYQLETAEAVAKSFDLFYIDLEQDR